MDGVFLTKHADVQLKTSETGLTQTLVMFLVSNILYSVSGQFLLLGRCLHSNVAQEYYGQTS